MSVGHSMNHQPFNITVRFQLEPSIRVAEGCANRTTYLNYYAQGRASKTSKLIVTIVVENDVAQLYGEIDLTSGFHKDSAYRVNVPLAIRQINSKERDGRDLKLRNDIAQSVMECVFVLES
jgi:hypothetical protein